MRLGLLSDFTTYEDLLPLRQFAIALMRHGLHVLWVASTDMAAALASDSGLVAADTRDLPATCRYVIPCQPYRLEHVQILCVDRAVWQDPALHTRLFTFLCLLQHELPCAVFHAWGTLPATYLTVYTARFLGIPAVVSYSRSWRGRDPRQTFMWQWVARHAAVTLAATQTEQTCLRTVNGFEPARIRVMDPASPTLASTMTTLYQTLLTLS